MEQIKIPDGYHSALNLHDTQIAIKTVKDFFQQTLSQKLNLLRVSAPVFVNPSSGLNDNLKRRRTPCKLSTSRDRMKQQRSFIPLRNGKDMH